MKTWKYLEALLTTDLISGDLAKTHWLRGDGTVSPKMLTHFFAYKNTSSLRYSIHTIIISNHYEIKMDIFLCSIYNLYMCISLFFYSCALVIFNQNNFPSHLRRHLFSDDVFTGVRVGQPVTQFPLDKIKSRPTLSFHSDIRHNRVENTIATSISCRL